jgi:anti-sigma regulatory factor (Ser/Thr protein kinase)
MTSACVVATVRSTVRKDSRPVTSNEAVVSRPVQRSAAEWPLMSHLELAALPTAVPCFRLHARAVAFKWGLSALAENIELIVSELVTNAIRVAERSPDSDLTPPLVRLWLTSDLHRVLIRVWDGSSQIPVRRDAGPDDDSGRGLMLVECLGSEWGVCRKASGKVVWVLVGQTIGSVALNQVNLGDRGLDARLVTHLAGGVKGKTLDEVTNALLATGVQYRPEQAS